MFHHTGIAKIDDIMTSLISKLHNISIINRHTVKSKEYTFMLMQRLSYVFTKFLQPKGSAPMSMLRLTKEIFVMLYSIQLKVNRSISGY